MTTVLIIGATGMLGQALTAEARARGYDVIGAARSGADLALDITDDSMVESAVADAAPDLVVNCAAMIGIDECDRDPALAWRTNARAVSVLANACRAAGAKLVQISTEHYYTGDGRALHDEAASPTFVNDYARTKYAGEAFALGNRDALVLRTNIAGFRGWEGRPTLVEWITKAAVGGAAVTLFDDAVGCTIDVRAASRATFDLCDKGAVGIYNLGSREVFTKGDFLCAVAEAIGHPLANPSRGTIRALDARRAESLGIDVAKAERTLGYPLPGLAEVARAIAEEYRERTCVTTA